MKNIILALVSIIMVTAAATFPLRAGLESGFVDDDTFRAAGVGYPSRGRNAAPEESACQAAMLSAQMGLLTQLAQCGIREIKGSVRIERYEVEKVDQEIRTSVSGFVKNVRVVEKRYDTAAKQCNVVVEVSEKNLKKKVTECVARALTR